MTLGLRYQRYHVVLEGYSGADWNTLSNDSKETIGYIFNIVGGDYDFITTLSKKPCCT